MKMPALNERKHLVSIIIPNFNHARYVGEAIDSVLQQDYEDVEIIVVDDGSTDDSREVITRYGNKVKYIHQENAGLSAARNTGIRASKGEFIGVLDADDMYESTFISALVNVLNANKDADGVYCGYQFVDQENNLMPQIENRPVQSDELYKMLLDGNFFVPESVFLRRYVYDDVGLFDEALRACEDWDVWLRVTKKFRIIHASEILTRHRILAGSMSTDPLRMLTARLAVLKKHVGNDPLESGSSIVHRAYGRAYLGSCVEYLQYGDKDRAYDCFYKMANICPDLLIEVDTYYQLGCSDQPKGRMGDLSSLNIKLNSTTLIRMMENLYAEEDVSNITKRLERFSYARAYYSLGVLAYNARNFAASRQFFLLAILSDYKLLFKGKVVFLWMKAWLNPKVLNWFKGLRQRTVSS
jgi:glycosyltransferase involved in cell wall biosynthesis